MNYRSTLSECFTKTQQQLDFSSNTEKRNCGAKIMRLVRHSRILKGALHPPFTSNFKPGSGFLK
jgi:hypothetical protein